MNLIPPPLELLTALRSSRRLLITSHANPDGDAIGSSLALARILSSIGKESVIWMRDPIPHAYSQLVGAEEIHVGERSPPGFPDTFDYAVLVECPSPDRTGIEQQLSELPLLNVDHHLGNTEYGEANWVDPGAAAVAQLVFRLASDLGAVLDSDTANALYLALVTDTGGFRFSNTTAASLSSAAEMVSAGASPEHVSKMLYERQPAPAMRLLALALSTLELHRGGSIATIHVNQSMFLEAGADRGHSEGLIDYPRSIEGVEAVALVREIAEGNFKISLRSRGPVSVEAVARARGGGGHRNAAGCSLEGSLDQVIDSIVEALAGALGDPISGPGSS